MSNPFLRCIIVSVDYADILAICLPYNRHHYSECMIVTCGADKATQEVAKHNNCSIYLTDSFWEDGAHFNKFRAMEEGLDAFGRHGWLLIKDADTLWPKETGVEQSDLRKGYLYTPRRLMCDPIPTEIPPESTWQSYPLHRQEREWAGYSQLFNAADPVLGAPPWHDINWKTAGGSDSFFQLKWPDNRKIRPRFRVLHLGPAGTNWAGRVSPYTNGAIPDNAETNRKALEGFFAARSGKSGLNRFDAEKIK